MSPPWLVKLDNLSLQFRGLQDVEELFEKDYQWINDVVTAAGALFKKEEEESSNVGDEETDENEDPNDVSTVSVAPVLLPQTPRVNFSKISNFEIDPETFLCNLGEKRPGRTA